MKKGFSIIECLIAILLLTIVLVGSMAFYFYSNQDMSVATHRRIATEIANAQLEQLKNIAYASVASSSTSVPIRALTGSEDVTVTDNPEAGVTYKQVHVRVAWNEPQKTGQEEVVVETFIAPR